MKIYMRKEGCILALRKFIYFTPRVPYDNHNKNEISLQTDVYFVGELWLFTIQVDRIIATQNL